MSDKVNPAGWVSAQAAASCARESVRWRSDLAEAIRAASGAVFVAVYTCPPDQPLEAMGAVEPERYRPVIEGIVRELLPRVERTEDKAEVWSKRTRGMPYAPLEEARELKLVELVRGQYLDPAGVDGLLTSYIIGDGAVLGFIVIATDQPSEAGLRDFGHEVGLVATIASQTVQSALALAAGFGAHPARQTPEARTLSTREREVARLVCEGYSDQEIAGRLELSEQTVGSHLRRIYAKLHVHSRGELLRAFRIP